MGLFPGGCCPWSSSSSVRALSAEACWLVFSSDAGVEGVSGEEDEEGDELNDGAEVEVEADVLCIAAAQMDAQSGRSS